MICLFPIKPFTEEYHSSRVKIEILKRCQIKTWKYFSDVHYTFRYYLSASPVVLFSRDYPV